MTTRKPKEEISTSDLKPGDRIEIAGLFCTIVKIESVFYYRPDAQLRFSLRSDDYLGRGSDVILFMGHNVPIKTIK